MAQTQVAQHGAKHKSDKIQHEAQTRQHTAAIEPQHNHHSNTPGNHDGRNTHTTRCTQHAPTEQHAAAVRTRISTTRQERAAKRNMNSAHPKRLSNARAQVWQTPHSTNANSGGTITTPTTTNRNSDSKLKTNATPKHESSTQTNAAQKRQRTTQQHSTAQDDSTTS